jgi:hypothetical protein
MSNKSSNFALMLPTNCMLTEWSTWSECSATECGQMGKIFRSRKILVESKYGGEQCPNNLNETQTCHKKCPDLSSGIHKIDCQVSEWSSWGECKKGKTCEDSFQEKTRTVLQKPANGGKECPELMAKRKCFIGNCKNKKLAAARVSLN